MLRKLLGCLSLALVLAGAVQAEQIKGKIKNIQGSRVTIGTGSQDRMLQMANDVKVFGSFNQKFRKSVEMEMTNGLGSLQPNQDVIAITEVRGRQEMVTQIRIQGTQTGTVARAPANANAKPRLFGGKLQAQPQTQAQTQPQTQPSSGVR